MEIFALNNTTDTIIGSLSGAVSTDQPEFVFTYADATPNTFEEGRSIGEFNGTTEVTLVSAPASDTIRIIRSFTITNKDDAQVTITLSYDDDTTPREIATVTLNSGDTWTNKGVYDSDGKLKQAFSASASEIAGEIDGVASASLADDDKIPFIDDTDTSLKTILWSAFKTALNSIYATLSGGNTFSGNQTFEDTVSIVSALPKLVLGNPTINSTESGRVQFSESGGSSINMEIHYDGSTNELSIIDPSAPTTFMIASRGSDTVFFPNGLSFDGGTNVLSEYDELVAWTPVLDSSGGGSDYDITITSAWAGKTGNMVDAYFDITVDAINTVGSGSSIIFKGLPYARTNPFIGNISTINVNIGALDYLSIWQFDSNTTAMIPIKIIDSSSNGLIDPSDVAVGDEYKAQIRYMT